MSAVSGGGWTPGPWAVFHDHPDPETAKSLGYIRTADSNRWNDWGFSAIADCFGCDTPEQAANARLIAAAPTQHETLLGIAEWIANHVPDCEGREYHLRAVNEALSRATGAAS